MKTKGRIELTRMDITQLEVDEVFASCQTGLRAEAA